DPGAGARGERRRREDQALALRRAADREATGLGLDAPVDAVATGQGIDEAETRRQAFAVVADRDREADLLAGVDRRVVSFLLDVDVGAEDFRRGRGLVGAIVAGAHGRGVVVLGARVTGRVADDVDPGARAPRHAGRREHEALARRAAGDREATGLRFDRPADAVAGGQRVAEAQARRQAFAVVADRDREADLLTRVDRGGIRFLLDVDLRAQDVRRGRGLIRAVVGRRHRRVVVVLATAVLRRVADDVDRGARAGGQARRPEGQALALRAAADREATGLRLDAPVDAGATGQRVAERDGEADLLAGVDRLRIGGLGDANGRRGDLEAFLFVVGVRGREVLRFGG